MRFFLLLFCVTCFFSCKSGSKSQPLETPESEEAEPTPQEKEAMEKISTEIVGLNLTDKQAEEIKGKNYNTMIDFFLPQNNATIFGLSFKAARIQAKKQIKETLTLQQCTNIEFDESHQDMDVGLTAYSFKDRITGHATCPTPMNLSGRITDYSWLPSETTNEMNISLTSKKDQSIIYESKDEYFAPRASDFLKQHSKDSKSIIIFDFPYSQSSLILPTFNNAVDKSTKELTKYLKNAKCTEITLPVSKVKSLSLTYGLRVKGIILGMATCPNPVVIKGLITGYSSVGLEAFTGINFQVFNRENGDKITEVNKEFGG